MSDDRISAIGAGPRQVTHEQVGGWAEIVVALRIARVLMIEAASGAVLVALATLVGGPWALVALVPAGISGVGRWLGHDPLDRRALLWWGVAVALLLALLPEPALIWWPWPWQARRATLWGLLWPARFPRWIAAAVVLRVVLVVAALRAKAQTWYLVQRLRREIIVPTASGAAYNAADLHNVEIPGVVNPHRRPGEPDAPERVVADIIIDGIEAEAEGARVLASDPVSGEPSVAVGGNGNGRHTRQVRIPTSMLGGDRQHVRDLLRVLHDAYGALADGEQLSRANLRRHGLSNNQARDLSAWFRDQGFATMDAGNNHELTEAGERYLDVALAGIAEARRRIE